MKKAKSIIRSIQAFMDSARGKTVLNYLYSWGAAIVILGTLFKLTHMEGADIMLFVGMGTEVIVFFFSAFERPYDIAEEEKREEETEEAMAHGGYAGQPIIINGSIVAGGDTQATADGTQTDAAAGVSPHVYTGGGFQPPVVPTAENISEMEKVTDDYIEQVRAFNEAIERISKQTEILGRNLEEMDTLGRNLTGINAIYEIQLRSAGGQLNSIDHINEQTRLMAKQVEELNNLYARMIEAMTTNSNRQQI